MDKGSSDPSFRPKTKVMIQMKWWHSVILKCPRSIRSPVADRLVSIFLNQDLDLKFKIAETKEEFEQAFSLLNKYYVQKKVIGTFPSGIYLTPYHALPQTRVLIALHQNQVVATLTLIRQNPLGLPMERNFCLKSCAELEDLAEASDLALDPRYENKAAEIILPLFSYLFQISTQSLKLTKVVSQIEWPWLGLAEALFEFTSRQYFSPQNGSTDRGVLLDLNSISKSTSQAKARWLNQMESSSQQMQFPQATALQNPLPMMSPELMEYFFLHKTSVFKKLNDFEKLFFHDIFQTHEYLRLIPKPKVLQFRPRRQMRYSTRHSGILHLQNDRSIRFDIQNVSHNGLGGMMNAALPIGGYHLELHLPSGESCLLKGQLMWQTIQGHFGFAIDSPPAGWLNFIQDLQSKAEKAPVKDHKIGA